MGSVQTIDNRILKELPSRNGVYTSHILKYSPSGKQVFIQQSHQWPFLYTIWQFHIRGTKCNRIFQWSWLLNCVQTICHWNREMLLFNVVWFLLRSNDYKGYKWADLWNICSPPYLQSTRRSTAQPARTGAQPPPRSTMGLIQGRTFEKCLCVLHSIMIFVFLSP